MKTLDEVIELSENILMFAHLPKDDTTSTAGLALYYLRKYQWQMTNPDGDHQQLLKCQALLADFYSNDPLTFSEVYDMDDKPVWMEWSDVKGWRLVRSYTSALGVKTVVLTDRYGVDFVFSEDTFERCEVMVYPKEHYELRY